MIRGNTRRWGPGSFLRNGKLAGRGLSWCGVLLRRQERYFRLRVRGDGDKEAGKRTAVERVKQTSYLLWHLLIAFHFWNKFQWLFNSKNKRWLKWLERRGGGEGKLLGEWKLAWASAIWESPAQMVSAVKIKCPTLEIKRKSILVRFGEGSSYRESVLALIL